MSFASDISAVTKTGTAQAVNGRSRLAGVYAVGTDTAGTLTFKSGGSGGTTKLVMNTPASAGAYDLMIPDDGILFEDGIHVTFSNNAHVTSVLVLFVGGAAA